MRRRLAPTIAAALTNPSWPYRDHPQDVAQREWRDVTRILRAAANIARLAEATHANGGQVCGAEWNLVDAFKRARVPGGGARKKRNEGRGRA